MSGRADTIRLADGEALRGAARTTLALRIGLGLTLVALLVLALQSARGPAPEARALAPAGRNPVVVLDISASVSGPANRRVVAALQTLAASQGTAGLVVFSDGAYELMPPGSPAGELAAVIRFFQPSGGSRDVPEFPSNPWAGDFRAGTQISTGLEEARAALKRAEIRNGAVVLVSDLQNGEDPTILAAAIADLRRDGITLRLVPLYPMPRDIALFESLVGRKALAASPASPRRASEESNRFRVELPLRLLVRAAFLVLALAANELLCARLLLGADTRTRR